MHTKRKCVREQIIMGLVVGEIIETDLGGADAVMWLVTRGSIGHPCNTQTVHHYC